MPDALRDRWRQLQQRARGSKATVWDSLPGWARPLVWVVAALLILVVPGFDDTWMRMFFLVALYATLGMGLNVVVGLAGLLDLGYVAFFAFGAYVVAIFSAPDSPHYNAGFTFWSLLPMAVVISMLAGILLGFPVLPLRGDYLAIVTLGFGEIIRILAVNMNDHTRGSSGLFNIAKPDIAYLNDLGLTDQSRVDDVQAFYVMIVIAAAVVWFVTARLRDSRVGRAWEAIREDEDVAESMGINTTRYKLMAFAMGAAIGGLGGAIYAPFIDFVSPAQFGLEKSINVLALVIIGGMGSTQGVIAGAALLIGVPELLQFQETKEFLSHFGWARDGLNTLFDGVNALTRADIRDLPPAEEWGDKLALYRFIVFGLLLVVVMVARPTGLFPSKRREMEFEEPARGGVQ
ncbi:MAG: branched-chain amino acid ABC transporter permease [Dehalococcoidia bacterium]